jgi:hypothetical protein
MAKKYGPGWYDTGTVGYRWFNGTSYTDEEPPAGYPDAPAGWYRVEGDLSRWWAGERWTDAHVADDGRVDVARNVRQAVVSHYKFGGTDEGAVAELLASVKDWPPLRIVSLQNYTSAVAPGTNVVAVFEWDNPSRA